jgi:hypothetical protein
MVEEIHLKVFTTECVADRVDNQSRCASAG